MGQSSSEADIYSDTKEVLLDMESESCALFTTDNQCTLF
jgi:hypothetical protein